LSIVKGDQFAWSTVFASNNANPYNLPPNDLKPRELQDEIKKNLDTINYASAKELLTPDKLYNIARNAGLEGCLRWKPRTVGLNII